MNAEIQNESYGPDERNVLDVYRAESSQPTPLLFFVHGGGFAGGTKDAVQGSIPLARCLEAGISIASIQHRLTDVAPFPAPMHDAARALQYIRHNAAEWNIDPTRVAACGVSSGSGIAQWLGFHEDLADLQNDDPISWQSTKVSCVIALFAQSTYDLRLMKDVVPGIASDILGINRLFGLPDDFDWATDQITPEVDALVRDCGPITLLTENAPH